jgi:O-antigen/teichoic acid export membrane protein
MGNILFSIIGYILTTTLVNSWLFYKTKSDYAIKYKNINKMVHKKMNTMAVNLSLIGVFSLVSSQIDKILIAEFISIEALANYSIGMLIGMSINTIFKSVISIFDVKFVKNKIGLIYYLFLFFLGSIVGWALTYLVSHVIVILYGDAYSSSIIYASIILSSMGIYFVAILSENHFLLYFDKNEKIAYSSSIFISLVVLLLISTIIMYPLEDEIKLILFALIYPVKLILVVFTHLFFEKYNTPTN